MSPIGILSHIIPDAGPDAAGPLVSRSAVACRTRRGRAEKLEIETSPLNHISSSAAWTSSVPRDGQRLVRHLRMNPRQLGSMARSQQRLERRLQIDARCERKGAARGDELVGAAIIKVNPNRRGDAVGGSGAAEQH